jgi:hypothetical protein
MTPRRAQRLGKPEVENLDESLPGNHDVGGFDVAVQDPGCVRPRQPIGNLGCNANSPIDGHWPIGVQLAQSASFDELHRDVRRPLVLGDVVNGDDVGVVES